MNVRVENWCGYEIRFIEENGEWWAILKDICDVLGLRVDKVSQRIDPSMLMRVPVKQSDHPLRVVRSRGDNETRWMIVVNEYGIYEALFASRRLEARKFRLWSAQVMKKLRQAVELEGYEVMKMTDTDVQARFQANETFPDAISITLYDTKEKWFDTIKMDCIYGLQHEEAIVYILSELEVRLKEA